MMITIVVVEKIVGALTIRITLEAIVSENLLCATDSARPLCYLGFHMYLILLSSVQGVHLGSAGSQVR